MRSSLGARGFPLSLSILLFVAAPCFSKGTITDANFTAQAVTEGTVEMAEENVTSSSFPELITMEETLLVIETSDALVEKNVTIGNPTSIELKCNFSTTRPPPDVNVYWTKGNDQINRTSSMRVFENILQAHIRLTVTDKMHMDNYSCVFEAIEERKGTFHFKVPEIYTKEKPLVNYERDSAVLNCNSRNYVPLEWMWYTSNGSEKVPIDITMKSKYEILPSKYNETKLKIKHLQATESGLYWCRAIFRLGESEGKQNLKVLTFLVPLKPFLAVTAEVVILVTGIFLYELYTKRRQTATESGKDFEQVEQLKSEDHNGVHKNNQRTRHRKSDASVN
ncbi:embigin [Phascolarctos cinereus]|uniref:Embigin n=1 Tax=Phascolarctos cinereus TaxID=38626 RepID=A0A6P5L285_PHACI|nr:embigin [Phascolarctos cinereus]XP_020852407.1 embigin [Phascolarctos cinereus]XP_020852415.1 embigin [Phascolarctos cinereus]XP_020852422.1 embigin [Phascolarctos cinereus]XP_020852425.1 embigin [Phascolarctos cinereus]